MVKWNVAIFLVLVSVFSGSAEAVTTGFRQVPARSDPDKPWRNRDTRLIKDLVPQITRATTRTLTRFGGFADPGTSGSGFFKTAKVAGRWWLIDPDGGKYLSVGVAGVRPDSPTTGTRSKQKTLGTVENWANQTNALLRKNGFNSTGAWSDTEHLSQAPSRLPYTLSWTFMKQYERKRKIKTVSPDKTGYPGGCISVFDPEFPASCDAYAANLIKSKDDPWLIGHFSDNEMPINEKCLDRYLALPDADPGKRAATEFLLKQPGRENAHSPITDTERSRFLELVVERYFKVVSAAMKKADPHHLYLGARWNGPAVRLPEVFRASGPYVDVHSINYYNAWTPRPDRIAMWTAESGKPSLISEFYTKAEDSGLPNNTGAGWEVHTQADRGAFYQNYVLGLIESRDCVGWHWFRYMDNNPDSRGPGKLVEDSNKGIVNTGYEPYDDLLSRMRELNELKYDLVRYFDERR